MKAFFVIMCLFSCINIQSSDREGYEELASDSDSLQEEGAPSKKQQPQDKLFPEEFKKNEDTSDDEDPGRGVMRSPVFQRSHKQWKKDRVEKEALKLSPEERLKLGIKLCTTKLEEVNGEKLSPHTISSIQACSLLLGTMAAHAAVAVPVVRPMPQRENYYHPINPSVQNQNQDEQLCCVIL